MLQPIINKHVQTCRTLYYKQDQVLLHKFFFIFFFILTIVVYYLNYHVYIANKKKYQLKFIGLSAKLYLKKKKMKRKRKEINSISWVILVSVSFLLFMANWGPQLITRYHNMRTFSSTLRFVYIISLLYQYNFLHIIRINLSHPGQASTSYYLFYFCGKDNEP